MEPQNYEAVVVMMPYGEYRANSPTLIDDAKSNIGTEFHNTSFLRVKGSHGDDIKKFHNGINEFICQTGIKYTTSAGLNKLAMILLHKGYDVVMDANVNGIPKGINQMPGCYRCDVNTI